MTIEKDPPQKPESDPTRQKTENLTFDEMVTALEDHLVVTRADIFRLFEQEIRCDWNGVWQINLETDKTVIASKDSGVCYEIGKQTIRQYDKITHTMQPREIPILISREHMPEQTVYFVTTGHCPDSFEAGPGDHPSDYE